MIKTGFNQAEVVLLENSSIMIMKGNPWPQFFRCHKQHFKFWVLKLFDLLKTLWYTFHCWFIITSNRHFTVQKIANRKLWFGVTIQTENRRFCTVQVTATFILKEWRYFYINMMLTDFTKCLIMILHHI